MSTLRRADTARRHRPGLVSSGTSFAVLLAAWVTLEPCTATAEIVHAPSNRGDAYAAYLDFALDNSPRSLERTLELAGETSFLALEQALAAARRGDQASMIERAEHAVALDPANADAHELLARTWFRLVDAGLGVDDETLAKAVRHATALVELGQAEQDTFEILARAHSWSARAAASRGDLAEVKRQRQRERDVLETWWRQLGARRAHDQLLEYAQTVGDTELEARLLGDDVRRGDADDSLLATLRLGELLRRLGRCEEAVTLLSSVAGRDDLNGPARDGIDTNLGACAASTARPELAVEALQRVLQRDPTNLFACAELADALWELGRVDDAESAWTDLEAALESHAEQRGTTSGRKADARGARAEWEHRQRLSEQALAHGRAALAWAEADGRRGAAELGPLQDLLAEILLQRGDAAGAEALGRRALERDPADESAAFIVADAAWLGGRAAEAKAVLDEATRRQPNAARHLERRARWELAHGRNLEAARLAGKAAAAEPEGARVVSLAQLLIETGRPHEAEPLLRPLVAADPLDRVATLLLADAVVEQGRMDEALAILDAGLPADPTDAYALERRARWDLSRRRGASAVASARAAHALVLAATPLDVHLVARFESLVGEALLATRENVEARAWFERAVARHDRQPRQRSMLLARATERSGDLTAALAVATAGLAAHPADLGLALERGRLLIRAGETVSGVALLRGLLESRAFVPTIHRQVALTLSEAGAAADARAVIEAATTRFPTDPLAHLVAGNIFERQGDLTRAEAEFRRALELAPDAASALNGLGYMLAVHDLKLGEAVRLLQRAVEIAPHDASYLDSLGWALFRQGRLPAAAENLEAAVARDRDPVIVMHLGTLREKQGRAAEALELYREALHFGLTEDLARVEARVAELGTRTAEGAKQEPGSGQAPGSGQEPRSRQER